ncbi:MAG: diheme cytochrome c [Terasakiella sp.]|uniref:diheme cytochrome c n=1 Tax=unclassified Terasakiella TaxID=2614952 RepID=UPI003AFF95A1
MLKVKALLLGGALVMSQVSVAMADERYRPIDNPVVEKECGSCHMAFQPQMMPKRSWEKIMDGLGDHFGEDASLSADVSQEIRDYLVANAADAGWWSGKFMRGIKEGDAPMRITEMPYWVREHRKEVPARAWDDPKVKTKANCQACHRDAKRGYYDDD